MLNSRLFIFIFLIFLCCSMMSLSSVASVNFRQKEMRVSSLLKFQDNRQNIYFESYKRELDYESQGLSLESRTQRETNLLANKIRQQVIVAYQAALAKKTDVEMAREEVKLNIEKDLNLAAPEFKNELLFLANFTLDSLDSAYAGGKSENIPLINLENAIRNEVIQRETFLNQEDFLMEVASVNGDENDAYRKDYNQVSELIGSLLAETRGVAFLSSSNQTISTAKIIKMDANISLQVKIEFLGASIEAGPRISFKRQYSTNAEIMAEGLSPVLLNDGNFDYWKRDNDGNIAMLNEQGIKREISFYCSTELRFTTDYVGAGGFKYLGTGIDASISKEFMNSVKFNSRKISLPETIAHKSVTIKSISELCHNDFLKAKINNTMTVLSSLNVMMKNVVAGITFSHPQTNCVVDQQCSNWFKDDVISLLKNKNFPRCIEENSLEKFRACTLIGLEGQNCPVYELNKHTSSGEAEFSCDVGLKCVKYEDQTFLFGVALTSSKGRCQIMNKKTYRKPKVLN